MPWSNLTLYSVSYIITQLLAPEPDVENEVADDLDDGTLPQANEGNPIPIVYGKVFMNAPQTLWYGNFELVPQVTTLTINAFKSKSFISGYDYKLGFALGLCSGPGVELHKIFMDNFQIFPVGSTQEAAVPLISVDNVEPGVQTISQPGLFGGRGDGGGFVSDFRFYSGTFQQQQNAYMVGAVETVGSLVGADLPEFNGTSFLVFEQATIGESPQLKNMSFEVARYPNTLGLTSNEHIVNEGSNPACVLFDLLTEPWNGLNLSTGDIDISSFSAAGSTLFTEGNGYSQIVSRPNDAINVIKNILKQIDGIMFQNADGQIALKLIRASDTPVQFVTDVDFTLDESNVKRVTNYSRSSWTDTYNQARVIFTDRSNNYERAAATTQDLANFDNAGSKIRSTEFSYPGVTTKAVARDIATRELTQISIPLVKVTRLRRTVQLASYDRVTLFYSHGLITVSLNLRMRVQTL